MFCFLLATEEITPQSAEPILIKDKIEQVLENGEAQQTIIISDADDTLWRHHKFPRKPIFDRDPEPIEHFIEEDLPEAVQRFLDAGGVFLILTGRASTYQEDFNGLIQGANLPLTEIEDKVFSENVSSETGVWADGADNTCQTKNSICYCGLNTRGAKGHVLKNYLLPYIQEKFADKKHLHYFDDSKTEIESVMMQTYPLLLTTHLFTFS